MEARIKPDGTRTIKVTKPELKKLRAAAKIMADLSTLETGAVAETHGNMAEQLGSVAKTFDPDGDSGQ